MSTIVTGANNINGFYQLDNTILKFDLVKDLDKLRVAMLLVQKENFSRLKAELPKGQFYTSIHEVATALDITKNKATRILKDLEGLKIISLIQKGTSKNTLTIYRMNSVTAEEVITPVVEDVVPDAVPEKSVKTKSINDIDFIECQLMEKIDICGEYGLVIECTDEDVPVLETLQAMDIDILRNSLGVASSKNNMRFNYILGIYQKKGGSLDRQRELVYGQLVYKEKVESMRKLKEMATDTEEQIAEELADDMSNQLIQEFTEPVVEPLDGLNDSDDSADEECAFIPRFNPSWEAM